MTILMINRHGGASRQVRARSETRGREAGRVYLRRFYDYDGEIATILRAVARACQLIRTSCAKMLGDDGSKENNNSSLQLCNYK